MSVFKKSGVDLPIVERSASAIPAGWEPVPLLAGALQGWDTSVDVLVPPNSEALVFSDASSAAAAGLYFGRDYSISVINDGTLRWRGYRLGAVVSGLNDLSALAGQFETLLSLPAADISAVPTFAPLGARVNADGSVTGVFNVTLQHADDSYTYHLAAVTMTGFPTFTFTVVGVCDATTGGGYGAGSFIDLPGGLTGLLWQDYPDASLLVIDGSTLYTVPVTGMPLAATSEQSYLVNSGVIGTTVLFSTPRWQWDGAPAHGGTWRMELALTTVEGSITAAAFTDAELVNASVTGPISYTPAGDAFVVASHGALYEVSTAGAVVLSQLGHPLGVEKGAPYHPLGIVNHADGLQLQFGLHTSGMSLSLVCINYSYAAAHAACLVKTRKVA